MSESAVLVAADVGDAVEAAEVVEFAEADWASFAPYESLGEEPGAINKKAIKLKVIFISFPNISAQRQFVNAKLNLIEVSRNTVFAKNPTI